MKHNPTLTITSLLSILFMTFHLTDDTLHAKGRDGPGRGLNPRCGAHPGRLAVRDALWAVHACHPRDGSGRRFSRRDRQVQRSLLVRLDASRARRNCDVLPHPLGARTVEPATGASPGSRRTLDRPARSVMVRTRDICNPSRRIRHESFDKVKRA
jgi:hypothetical protein